MNLDNYLNAEQLKLKKDHFKKIFFYRICGTGMGAAACLLREKGLNVSGGDFNYYPPMSDYLDEQGIPCLSLVDIDLSNYDLIVVGNVVGRQSEDARKIEESGVPFCSFPAALGAFVLGDCNVIGIAGTHGKTTTTYFGSQVFKNLGQDPGYFIGGVIPGKKSSVLGDKKYFFIESDEYDCAYFEKFSKFRQYEIDTLILTSLEFDHADIFSSIEDIKDEFRGIKNSLKSGLIYCEDYEESKMLVEEFNGVERLSYGRLNPKILEVSKNGTRFELKLGESSHTFFTNVTGEHNIQNLASIILYSHKEGFSIDQIQGAIEDLAMVKRREESRGRYKGMLVIDDFAHHPRAVLAILDSVKSKNRDKKIIGVLEPNSATGRSDLFQEEFFDSLKNFDATILCKPSRDSNIKGHGNLDLDLISSQLKKEGQKSFTVSELKDLRNQIDELCDKDSILLVMSNGTCLDLWKSDFVNELH